MAEFDEIRQALDQARNDKGEIDQAYFLSREKLSRVRREKDSLLRVFDEDNQAHALRLRELNADEEKAIAEVDSGKTAWERGKISESSIYEQFLPYTDPRGNLDKLNDRFPFLLLPIRIETRFKKITTKDVTTDQLWIRIYPDDCAVDTFEEILSETEIKNAQVYWSALWQAGGIEDQERGAWRALVSSHGSGRSSYIIEKYKPVNAGDNPVKDGSDDVILVISTEEMPSEDEQGMLLEYWKQLWYVAGTQSAEEDLFAILVDSFGEPRAAELVEKYAPSNFSVVPAPPGTKADVITIAKFLEFPPSGGLDTKQQSWSRAPRVNVMPDRFVVMGYQDKKKVFEVVGNHVPAPLIVGPDPNAAPEDRIEKDANGDIVVNADMRWMVDFDEAIRKGLGFKVDITPVQARAGFERIVALGVRLSTDEQAGSGMVETLIEHHRLSRKGFAILKQGTPTNNTDAEGAGYQSLDSPDESFDDLKKEKLFEVEDDWFKKKDGQWLAESLGIKNDSLFKVKNSGHTDQIEGRAMNIALFPTTLGYMMETLMRPVFSDGDIADTRLFFNRFVSGRGLVPAVKIGKQPYGILPTTAFSKIRWTMKGKDTPGPAVTNVSPGKTGYIGRLYAILNRIDIDWALLADNASHVGKAGDAHQTLLDAVGLNASSVEFYQRNAESVEELYNRFNLLGWGAGFLAWIIAGAYIKSGQDLLSKFGYTGKIVPDILNKLFLESQNQLKGPLVDDRPLSESEIIRKYTPDPDSKNYIEWLIGAAQTSHDALRKQQGFIDNKIPTALLYLMLRHALDLSYVEVSLLLHANVGLLSQQQIEVAKAEPAFLHIKNTPETESKWQYLYKKESLITGNRDLLVGDYIPKIIKTEVASEYLSQQLNALEQLKNIPTARLERAFTEHIDCCSYRLDAWKGGIINYQLAQMRQFGNENPVKGTYIGAYGWLENVRSENKILTPVTLDDPELAKIFIDGQKIPLVKDSTNGGHISAPSLNHAVTASILRNGYMSNSSPEALRVNLSSERVRKALAVIEGIQGGQSLGALLGYYLERGLHDGHPGVELDFFIYQLRKAFPLVSNRIQDTQVDETSEEPIDSVEAIEARNVVDGLSLIEQINKSGNASYPFGITFLPAVDTPSQSAAINAEVQNILDINDALADVAMAESVHQVVLGNYDRASATLDTYSKGNFPPIPDVIQTPRSGTSITHRLGLQFETEIDATLLPTARSQAEPALNKWLSGILPALEKLICTVSYNTVIDEEVTADDLGLQPVDLLYLINTEDDQSMKEIDDRIVKHVLDKPLVRPDTVVTINYMKPAAGKITFFELAPLVNSIRSVVLRSRPLTPNDIVLSNEAEQAKNTSVHANVSRIELRYTALKDLHDNELTDYLALIGPLVLDTVANRAAILTQIDGLMEDFTAILVEAGSSGLPQTGFGFIAERKRQLYKGIIDKLDELIKRWDTRLVDFDNLITKYDALPGTATNAGKFDLLLEAKRKLSTIEVTILPPDPDDFKDDLLDMRGDFVIKQGKFEALFAASTKSIATLLTDIGAEQPISAFDVVLLEFADIEDQIILFAGDLAVKANNLKTDLHARLDRSKELIDEAKITTDNKRQVDLVQEAVEQLFHEDFKVVPEFSVSGESADEWAKSYAAKDQLQKHSIEEEKIDFPLDDWLYGIARVREKIHHWENIVFLAEAFNGPSLELHPVQLPFKEDDTWLALPYPKTYTIESDRLLYTAHYAVAFDKTKKQCGLLLDEWTEVIPAPEETAGIAFHYDRPNTEPPQVMLLAMPTDFRGAWQWEDLVEVVNETLDMAKKRAIEPAQVDALSYARFLPSVVSSMTVHPLTVSLNYAFNNGIHEILVKP
jgi:hypothetical protein